MVLTKQCFKVNRDVGKNVAIVAIDVIHCENKIKI
jgi:hypothetical protein